MEALTLLLVLYTVYGHSRHVSQAGLVSAHLTEVDDALLATDEEETLKGVMVTEWPEDGQSYHYEQKFNQGSEEEERLTPEAQSRSILGEQLENVKSYDADDDKTNDLSQRSVWEEEEEESMLVAGLHLERKREDTEKLSNPKFRPLAAITPTQVSTGSAHLPTPDTVTSPKTFRSVSSLEDFVTEASLTPSTLEEKNGQVLEDVTIRTTNSKEDSTREINTPVRPDESAFTYNTAQAAALNHETKRKTSKALSKPLTVTQEKKVQVKAPAKNNKTNVTMKTEEKKTMNNTQKESRHFPYFTDNYCPPECACYGRVVQCSDKGVDRVPFGIPRNSRYVLLMNNHIDRLQLDLLSAYGSMEFLALTNNRLTDAAIEGAFEGVPTLKRLYLDTNLLRRVPNDLPKSLEELRLNNNQISGMSQAAWTHCPGLLILSMSNNSLGNGSASSLPNAVLSPLCKLQTLNLDHNRLGSVPLGLPLSVKELYLKGNRIEEFRSGAFNGKSELVVLDLSGNRLTNKGLLKDSLLNATHLESLNLEGNRLKQIPQHLPVSLKTLNLEGNFVTSVKKSAFGALKNLEHLGLARNEIFKVAAGAFGTLSALHQLDLAHNALRQVPRQLPKSLHSVALSHNRIQAVPRDAFCWGGEAGFGLSGLVRVQLQNNVIDLGGIDTQAFRCLRGFQVVDFY